MHDWWIDRKRERTDNVHEKPTVTKVTEHEEGGQRPASGWYRGENPTLKTNKSAITNYR